MKQLFEDVRADKNAMGQDTKYSRAIRIPQYTPSDDKPNIYDAYNTGKYRELMAKINKSSVSDAEKEFLKFAATRHIVFNYSKIADYYAHSDKEMQTLMEESALVIIDKNDAIAYGYIQLSEKMQQLIDEEIERDKNAREAKSIMKQQQELLKQKLKEAENKEEKKKLKKEAEAVKEALQEDHMVLDEDAMKMAEESDKESIEE